MHGVLVCNNIVRVFQDQTVKFHWHCPNVLRSNDAMVDIVITEYLKDQKKFGLLVFFRRVLVQVASVQDQHLLFLRVNVPVYNFLRPAQRVLSINFHLLELLRLDLVLVMRKHFFLWIGRCEISNLIGSDLEAPPLLVFKSNRPLMFVPKKD